MDLQNEAGIRKCGIRGQLLLMNGDRSHQIPVVFQAPIIALLREVVDYRNEEIFRVFCEIFNDFPTDLSAVFQLSEDAPGSACTLVHLPLLFLKLTGFVFKTYRFCF